MSFTTRATAVLDRDQLTPGLASFPKLLVRVGLSVVLTYLVSMAAFAAFFIGLVSTTGCFFSCEDPNLLAGIPLLLLASLLAALAIAVAWWGLVDRHWRTAIRALTVLAIGGATLLVWLGLSG